MDLAQALDQYLGYLAVERGSSRNTVASYGRDLRRYIDFLGERNVTSPDDVTRLDIEAHLAGLTDAGLAASSVQRAASAIKGFHKFMVGEQITQNHPSAGLPLPKRPDRLPQVLSREQVFSLLDDPFRPELEPSPRVLASGRVDARPQAAFHRDKAILEVLYGCGLRVSELCGLDRREVLLEDEMLRVMGKGSKERVVPILGTARRALATYLQDWRPVLANPTRSGDAVFLNERGGRISRQAVHRMVERYGAVVGIRGLHPHTLRHTYATHMLEGGMDLRYVQELLGHASISTTQLYTHIDLTHVRMVYLEAHPRARGGEERADHGGASAGDVGTPAGDGGAPAGGGNPA